MKFRESTKFFVIVFVCMAISICFSAGFSYYVLKNSPKTEIINNYNQTNKIELKQVEYKNSEIPNGVATKTTIQNSLNSSVSVIATTSTGRSMGSGTVIASDNINYSYIVTCYHIIENSTTKNVKVIFNDKTEKTGVLVGADPKTDVAVLKVEGITYTISETILDNNQIFAGENIYIIGNSLGIYDFTVTTGCLSQQQERQVTIENYGTFDVLQTDSAVNSGVSGGGMFDTSGTLVGMISCGYDPSIAQNINFVLPIYKVMTIVANLIENIDTETGMGYVDGRYNIELYIATWGDTPSYPIVTEVPKNSSFYGTNKETSLMAYDLLKAIQIDDGTIITLSSAQALVDLINEAKDNNLIHVGTKLKFTACENRGINNLERSVTITIKQFVFNI